MNYCKFPWHKLLLKVLRQEIPISYMVELTCGNNCPEYDEFHPEWYGVELPFPGSPAQVTETRTLIERALCASPWIDSDDVPEFLARIMRGDDDPVLSLLVPYLENLRAFCVPADAVLLQSVFRKMASAATSHTTGQQSGDTARCLPNLVLIRCGSTNEVGIQLEDLASYVGIPSVRRVVAINARRRAFDGWPEGAPTSNAQDVYFPRSSVSAEAITGFARGFRGPCVFRQLHNARPSDFFEYDSFDWDHYEILITAGPGTDGWQSSSRRETIEVRYPDTLHQYVDPGPDPRPPSPGTVSVLDIGPYDWRSIPNDSERLDDTSTSTWTLPRDLDLRWKYQSLN